MVPNVSCSLTMLDISIGDHGQRPEHLRSKEEVRLHFLDYWRVIRVRWGLILLAFLLVVMTTAVVTYFQPREYQSSVFIEAKLRPGDKIEVPQSFFQRSR